jgi:hypothetical protein
VVNQRAVSDGDGAEDVAALELAGEEELPQAARPSTRASDVRTGTAIRRGVRTPTA